MKTSQLLLIVAVILAVVAGYFGAQQILVWPYMLGLSGILFAVAAQQRKS
jgi:hypothetical protein